MQTAGMFLKDSTSWIQCPHLAEYTRVDRSRCELIQSDESRVFGFEYRAVMRGHRTCSFRDLRVRPQSLSLRVKQTYRGWSFGSKPPWKTCSTEYTGCDVCMFAARCKS